MIDGTDIIECSAKELYEIRTLFSVMFQDGAASSKVTGYTSWRNAAVICSALPAACMHGWRNDLGPEDFRRNSFFFPLSPCVRGTEPPALFDVPQHRALPSVL
jgi:hypothetical protein